MQATRHSKGERLYRNGHKKCEKNIEKPMAWQSRMPEANSKMCRVITRPPAACRGPIELSKNWPSFNFQNLLLSSTKRVVQVYFECQTHMESWLNAKKRICIAGSFGHAAPKRMDISSRPLTLPCLFLRELQRQRLSVLGFCPRGRNHWVNGFERKSGTLKHPKALFG